MIFYHLSFLYIYINKYKYFIYFYKIFNINSFSFIRFYILNIYLKFLIIIFKKKIILFQNCLKKIYNDKIFT